MTWLFCGAALGRLPSQAKVQTPAAPDELSDRLQSAIEARKSGDPLAIGQASQRVIALALAEMAKLRLDQKAYDKAIALCEESLTFEDTVETRVEIAIASLYAKKLPEALRQASSATERTPQNALAWTIQGEALLTSHDYAGAASALGKALELKSDAQALYALGVAELGLGNPEAAAKAFREFFAVVGDFGWSRVLVGRAYQGQGLFNQAETEFRIALDRDPRTPHAHYFWALNLLKENGGSPTAEVYAQLDRELRLNPRHFEANYVLGLLASNRRNYQEADRYLHLAAEVNPSAPETWVLLGLNAQNRQDNQAAERSFRKAINLTKGQDPREHWEVRKAYFGLGRILMSQGKVQEAQELLKQARELEAQYLAEGRKGFKQEKGQDEKETMGGGASDALTSDLAQGNPLLSTTPPSAIEKGDWGASRLSLGAAGKTERHLQAVLGSTFNDLATAEALQEKYDLSWNHYREAASWDSQIPGLRRNLGLAAYYAGQPGEAILRLSKVVAETPGDAQARAVLGLAYFATEDFAKAALTITPLADRAMQDPQVAFAWAKSLAKTGRKLHAVHTLEGLEQTETNPSANRLVQVGQLWQELGEPNRAAKSFGRALLLDPENAEAKCGLHPSECPK